MSSSENLAQLTDFCYKILYNQKVKKIITYNKLSYIKIIN